MEVLMILGKIFLFFLGACLTILGIAIVLGLYALCIYCIVDYKNFQRFFKPIYDFTIVDFLLSILFLPFYLFILPGVTVAGICYILYRYARILRIVLIKNGTMKSIDGFIESVKKIGNSIKNFFNKKPLEFLKNYSIRIEKK